MRIRAMVVVALVLIGILLLATVPGYAGNDDSALSGTIMRVRGWWQRLRLQVRTDPVHRLELLAEFLDGELDRPLGSMERYTYQVRWMNRLSQLMGLARREMERTQARRDQWDRVNCDRAERALQAVQAAAQRGRETLEAMGRNCPESSRAQLEAAFAACERTRQQALAALEGVHRRDRDQVRQSHK